ncbi:MAG: potassium channel family protein [Snowella sp.]|nr:potassium channel family protein [Snowella sp.]
MLHNSKNFHLILLISLVVAIATMMNANNTYQLIMSSGILVGVMILITLKIHYYHSALFPFKIIPISAIFITLSFIQSLLYFYQVLPEFKVIWLTLSIIIRIAFFSYAWVLMIFVLLQSRKAKVDTIIVAVCGYLLIGIIWSFLYLLCWELDPQAFYLAIPRDYQYKPWNLSIYFSFTSLTTVGYGDIIPVNRWAMFLANMEAVLGSSYLAVVVARLVSLYESEKD